VAKEFGVTRRRTRVVSGGDSSASATIAAKVSKGRRVLVRKNKIDSIAGTPEMCRASVRVEGRTN